jgi:hypothetical protein
MTSRRQFIAASAAVLAAVEGRTPAPGFRLKTRFSADKVRPPPNNNLVALGSLARVEESTWTK